MEGNFSEITPLQIQDNVFKLISDWMLITAGTMDSCNTMTASWGGLGVLWGRNISICYVRPSRFTYGFMEKSETYSLSFFDDMHKDALRLCGSKSGREMDKINAANLTKIWDDEGAVIFREAKLTIICKKLYYEDFNPDRFLDPTIMNNYPKMDFHRAYIGQIVKCIKAN